MIQRPQLSTSQGIVQQLSVRAGRPGFVLLLVLAAVAVVGLWSAAVARTTLEVVSLAAQSQRDLQHRWTRASLQHVLGNRLSGAPQLMDRGQWSGQLAERSLELRFADERQKISLPELYLANDSDAVVEMIRRAAPWKTKPLIVPRAGGPPLWSNWGDIWDLAQLPREQLIRDLPEVTRTISLWSGHTVLDTSRLAQPRRSGSGSPQPGAAAMTTRGGLGNVIENGDSIAAGPVCVSCWFRSGRRCELWILDGASAGRMRVRTFVW